jgi:hypothetical protein
MRRVQDERHQLAERAQCEVVLLVLQVLLPPAGRVTAPCPRTSSPVTEPDRSRTWLGGSCRPGRSTCSRPCRQVPRGPTSAVCRRRGAVGQCLFGCVVRSKMSRNGEVQRRTSARPAIGRVSVLPLRPGQPLVIARGDHMTAKRSSPALPLATCPTRVPGSRVGKTSLVPSPFMIDCTTQDGSAP